MKYFVNSSGQYLGGFGCEMPEGDYIEVSFPPENAKMIWNFNLQIWEKNLAELKIERLDELESNYTAAQKIYLQNGHIFIISLKGNDFLDIERQINAAQNLGSASLISVDTTGVLRVINNIPYAIWLEFYELAKNISVSNLALKFETIIAIKTAQSIVGLEAININQFPAIQTITLDL